MKVQRGDAEAAEIEALHESQGYPVTDMTDNELAKLHIRHMVGGQRPGRRRGAVPVRVPRAPGALLRSSTAMGERWNISLFHYRNHGAAYGRVLAGIQVPDADRAEFAEYLAQLGYPYADETENPAYRLFLKKRVLELGTVRGSAAGRCAAPTASSICRGRGSRGRDLARRRGRSRIRLLAAGHAHTRASTPPCAAANRRVELGRAKTLLATPQRKALARV